MASTVTSGEYPFLQAFAENAGFDLAKVTRVQVDNKVRDRLLSEGKVDAISGYASSAMPTYVATGVKARFMLFSDFGLLNYGTAVMTQPKRLAEEPELCAAFVDGALQGLKATMLDPAEAMKVFFKQVPEMALASQAREQIRVGTGINIYVSARDIIRAHGMGYMEPKDYEVMTDLVMKYIARDTDKRPAVADMMTNRFVGAIALTEEEWGQTQKNAQKPNELSGGMRQRVAICRALVYDPELLLMDEPFSGLDAITRDEMNELLLDLWQQYTKTALFVTHSIREAVFLADRVLVMTRRPATIVEDLTIPFARPRPMAIGESREFNEICGHLRERIEESHHRGPRSNAASARPELVA